MTLFDQLQTLDQNLKCLCQWRNLFIAATASLSEPLVGKKLTDRRQILLVEHIFATPVEPKPYYWCWSDLTPFSNSPRLKNKTSSSTRSSHGLECKFSWVQVSRLSVTVEYLRRRLIDSAWNSFKQKIQNKQESLVISSASSSLTSNLYQHLRTAADLRR